MNDDNDGVDAIDPRTPEPEVARPRRLRWWLAGALAAALTTIWLVVIEPNLRAARINRNESAAIAALKNISSAQAQMQAAGVNDGDGNGQGEYAFFGQLAGSALLRRPSGQPPVRCDPPVLSARFGDVVDGRVRVGGYWFEMFLATADGEWVAERADQVHLVSIAESEVLWTCYAYPVELGVTGRRAFMTNQSGDVLMTNQAGYAGDDRPEPGLAGFAYDGDPTWIVGARVAANTADAHGHTWVVG
ncbi:MAG: hypothetical protein ACE37K_18610 [Planctomycetota bacterium]